MADTIITNTPGDESGSSAVGSILLIIVLLGVAIGGFYLWRNGMPYGPAAANPAAPTNINVTVPTPTIPTPDALNPTEPTNP